MATKKAESKVEDKSVAKKPILNFDIDFNSATSVVPIAAAAWEIVKGAGDPSFEDADPNFQRQLVFHAQSALRTGPQQGDTSLARFEQAVTKLKEDSAAAKTKAAASK